MNTDTSPSENADIPVLQEPAQSAIDDDLLDELDIPILTSPADDKQQSE